MATGFVVALYIHVAHGGVLPYRHGGGVLGALVVAFGDVSTISYVRQVKKQTSSLITNRQISPTMVNFPIFDGSYGQHAEDIMPPNSGDLYTGCIRIYLATIKGDREGLKIQHMGLHPP